jgi:hypothetical protein
VHQLPDDELSRYRDAIEAVTIGDVRAAAREHIDLDRMAIVAVGDADVVGGELESAGLGEIEVIAEEPPAGGSDDAAADESDEEGK